MLKISPPPKGDPEMEKVAPEIFQKIEYGAPENFFKLIPWSLSRNAWHEWESDIIYVVVIIDT